MSRHHVDLPYTGGTSRHQEALDREVTAGYIRLQGADRENTRADTKLNLPTLWQIAVATGGGALIFQEDLPFISKLLLWCVGAPALVVSVGWSLWISRSVADDEADFVRDANQGEAAIVQEIRKDAKALVDYLARRCKGWSGAAKRKHSTGLILISLGVAGLAVLVAACFYTFLR
jgi:hypothetical protein